MGWAARFLTAVSFLAAGILFAPDTPRISGSGYGAAAAASAARQVHLLAFATAWGAGLWVTFIGGIVMFKGTRLRRASELAVRSAVGYSKNKEMAKWRPALAAMNWKFGMIHVLSSLASFMSFGSLAMHSWYLSSKLNL
ncbi:unnamed protein product [Urochloa decumbens]|uniref:DUF4149 domain-containing protein n=1 Tax=Urochloa decumbens TaxID=240449 RepID=A0ABC9CBH7_9POAL